MDTFIFAANAVLPVVLMTALGYFIKRLRLCTPEFTTVANRLCFRVFLPIMLFRNLYGGGGVRAGDLPIVGFATAAIVTMFLAGLLIVRVFIRDPRQKGVVLQCVFRSNFAIIGLPLAQALAGEEGARLAAVVSVAAIPLFNALAVISLTVFRRDEHTGKGIGVGKMAKGVATNPMVIGVVIALLMLGVQSLLGGYGIDFSLRDVTPVWDAIDKLAAITSPLALVTLGARFEFSAVRSLAKQITVGAISRLVFAPLLVIGAAYLLFPSLTAAQYACLVALTASPVSVSSVVMACEMDGDETLAGQLVVWTTIFSMATVFAVVVALRTAGLF